MADERVGISADQIIRLPEDAHVLTAEHEDNPVESRLVPGQGLFVRLPSGYVLAEHGGNRYSLVPADLAEGLR